jgi:23S rRNA (uracil1939-C5)-methyltransferase
MRKKNKFEPIIIPGLEITDAAAEGKAIARHDNLVIFLTNAVPGDVADVQIFKKKKNYSEGKAIRFSKLSEKRCEPFCSHFGMCGGCKWQHMQYKFQLEYKQKQVSDSFERIAKAHVQEIQPIIPSTKQQQYRNKLEFTFSDYRWLTDEDMQSVDKNQMNMNGLGFHIAQHFDRVLDIETCYLQAEPMNALRNEVKKFCLEHSFTFYNPRKHEGFMRNMLVRNTSLGEWMVIVVFGENHETQQQSLLNHIKECFPMIDSLMYVVNTKMNDTISDLPIELYHGKDFITEQLENLKFRIGPVSFFQTNSMQALTMYNLVKEFAQISKNDVVYDLYTGTGTIANFVASDAKKVVGVEYIPSAVEDAKLNSVLNHIENTQFYSGDLAKIFTDEFIAANEKPSVIITDPPRSGMHPLVVEQLLKIEPQRIVYVSCNPATQARDCALLAEKYVMKKIQPIDMFPHTHHVENICLMELKEFPKE